MPNNNHLLGRNVSFTHELRRVRGPKPGERRWEEQKVSDAPMDGVIIGERTVSDGFAEGGYDEARTYTAKSHRVVWLVAYDMRRRHMLVPKEYAKLSTF